MSNFTRKLAIFSCFLFTSFCFWKAGAGLIGGADAEILPSAQAAMSPSLSPSRVVTTPIQQMRPGMRVVWRNPLRIETEATIDPTPAGWRLVSMRMLKEDGTYFEAELLRPLSWIYRHHAQPGEVIQLNMPEMYVLGAAEVLAVSACPPIDPGNGPVVISTFKNTADNILNIYVEGETEPIGVTAGHPIWSEDRQAFIHSEKLQPGERLRSAVGRTVRITSIEIRAGPEPVYNLEVAGEHVYSVTNSGLLVHNSGPCNLVPRGQNFDLESLYTSTDVLSSSQLVSQFDTLKVPRSLPANAQISSVGRGVGGHQVIDRIAGEAQGAFSQANRILESGGANTRWSHIYQRYRGTGGFREFIARRNALHQEAERLLIDNPYILEAQDAGFRIAFNRGSRLGATSSKGNLLRPDIQIRAPGGRYGIIDWTTEGSAGKIFKYGDQADAPWLINVTLP